MSYFKIKLTIFDYEGQLKTDLQRIINNSPNYKPLMKVKTIDEMIDYLTKELLFSWDADTDALHIYDLENWERYAECEEKLCHNWWLVKRAISENPKFDGFVSGAIATNNLVIRTIFKDTLTWVLEGYYAKIRRNHKS
jgi:hypothetical protein